MGKQHFALRFLAGVRSLGREECAAAMAPRSFQNMPMIWCILPVVFVVGVLMQAAFLALLMSSPNVRGIENADPIIIGVSISVLLICVALVPWDLLIPERNPLENIEKLCPAMAVEVDEAEVCAICLEETAVGELHRTLKCSHSFHSECLEQWRAPRPRSFWRCPLCRFWA